MSFETSRPAAGRGKSRVGLVAALLLTCACTDTRRSPGEAAGGGGGASPPIDDAAAHLVRAEEARDREEYDLARQEAEKARDLSGNDGNWEAHVRARNLLGGAASRRGDYKAALDELNATLAMAREKLGPGHPEVAHSHYQIGSVYVSTGRPREGLEHLEKALALRRAAGGAQTKEVAAILVRMGLARSEQGEDERALPLFDEAAAIGRALPGKTGLAGALIGRGNALWGAARYDEAIEALDEAVRLLEAAKPRRGASLAAAYANLGTVYWSKSDYDEALVYYEKALPLQVAAYGEAHHYVGIVHYNIATLRLMKRDYDACIASAERALEVLVPVLGERHSQVAQVYNVIGGALTGKGEVDRGLGVLQKALAVQLTLPGKGDRNAALIYASLAGAYKVKGDLDRALPHYRRALAIDLSIYGERHPDVAEDYVNLGDLHLKKGEEARALQFYAKAIAANTPGPTKAGPDLDPPFDTAFSEEFLLKALKGAARARARLGARKAERRQAEAAALVYDHASRLVDRMRAGYRAEGSKLQVAEGATEIYDEAIRTELELHRLTGEERHLERAFGFAERSKGGVLRDALNEAEARSFAGIPGALLEQERSLRIDLAAADHRLGEAQVETGVEEARLHALREEQFALKRRYEALRQRFEREYPDYYDLKYRFDTAGPGEIRELALDERTVLVEYFLGKERVFIFTITRDRLEVTAVPRDASLETELADLRKALLARDVASHARSAHRLYGMLLSPVEGRLAGKDLVVVPDGPLSTVPFEALLKREASPDTDPRELAYVLRDHAVGYAYSATLLVQGLRHGGPGPVDEFLGFAPVFAEAAFANAPSLLPASRKEVTDVRGLFRKREGLFGGWLSRRSRVYLGREATEGRLKSAGLERYRYVHLATHGVVDEEHPGLSRLLLAPETGSGEDGILHLGEIYNLRLNADLVVLSACDTGLGRIARGEGIIGLTRGFLYAGARSLVVSLWPVSDASAAGLVSDFYAELLSGRPKAQALREAKLRAMGRNPEYAKPYYWSPLVLVGQPW